MNKILPYLSSFGLWMILAGCDSASSVQTVVAKRPRPVEVQSLQIQAPPAAALVSASVASWKTEEIGFEVGGRIEWVAEPNTNIEGRVVDSEGNLVVEGTPVARVESERFRLQVESATAEVARAEQSVAATEIEIEKSLPSQMRAAEAEKSLAKTEMDRSERLFQQNAGAQADVDRDRANYQTAVSRIEQLQATMKAKQAELHSLELQVDKAKQALRDAQRSLEDCTLYSSFRGQIADVAVVPGSVVSAGQAVATIQMMDPIKVELEVSAEESRRLRKRQRIPLWVTRADGSTEENDGFLYLVDPVADPQTRTFTLTLLMLNKKNVSSESELEKGIPTTDQTWRLDFSFLPGAEEGLTYAVEEAVHHDAEGPFLWRVDNFNQNQTLPKDHLLHVSKMRVKMGATKLPFLGNWVFQQVEVLDPSFDSQLHLIAGKLSLPDGQLDDWKGDTILVQREGQWMVRPGDLVKVDLSDGDAERGYYVPMDAIAHDGDKTYLFLTDSSGEETVVRRVEVAVVGESAASTTSSLRRVEPAGATDTLADGRYVTRGVHYLRDGEAVKITAGEEGNP